MVEAWFMIIVFIVAFVIGVGVGIKIASTVDRKYQQVILEYLGVIYKRVEILKKFMEYPGEPIPNSEVKNTIGQVLRSLAVAMNHIHVGTINRLSEESSVDETLH